MSKITKSRRLAVIVGVLTVAVLLQGCLLGEKLIADFYLAVIGIPDGVEQEIVRIEFSIPDDGYCNGTPLSIFVSGNISQSGPRPSWLYKKYLHVDGKGDLVRMAEVNVMVDPVTGVISEQFFPNVIDTGCFRIGDKLIVSVQPNLGNVEVGAQIATLVRYVSF